MMWVLKQNFKKSAVFSVVALATMHFSINLKAQDLPFARSRASSFISPNLFIDYLSSKESLRVSTDNRTARNFMELKSPTELVRHFQDSRDHLEFEKRIGNTLYRLHFEADQREHKYLLVAVSYLKLHKHFFDGVDGGSFDSDESPSDTNAESSTSETPNDERACHSDFSVQAQIQSMRDQLISADNCTAHESDLKTLALDYRHKDENPTLPQVRCLQRFPAYRQAADDLLTIIKTDNGTKFACSSTQPSSYDQKTNTVILGREAFSGSAINRGKVLFHELLHAALITDEDETKALVECCAYPSQNTSSCALAKKFNQKTAQEEHDDSDDKHHANRKVNVNMGAASANPDASPSSPITPPKLTYSPDTSSVQTAKAEVEKVRAPMMAARQYSAKVAQAFFAGMGSTAHAAVMPNFPKQVSKDEWTTTVRSVDPKTGEIKLNLGVDREGREIIGSASIPFSGTGFSEPEIKIEHGDNRVVNINGTSISLPTESSTSAVKPARNLKSGPTAGSDSNAAGSAVGSDLLSGAGLGANPGASGNVGTAGVSGSRGSASLASSSPGDAAPPKVTASTLKRMFARSQNPASIINAHLDDLKANSMSVKYDCVWYPRGFKGKEAFDLDTYQGRKCGSP